MIFFMNNNIPDSLNLRWFKKAPATNMQLMGSKLRQVIRTSFYNKLCSERLHIDERDLGTRLYRVGIPIHHVACKFWMSCLILLKIIEKYDQKLVACSCNIQNVLTTSWFVITILYKRVPKSLSSMQSHSKHN